MAQLRLTTKGMIAMFVALSLISFGVGFAVWKVSGLPNLSATYSEAGGNQGGGGTPTGPKSTTSCDSGGNGWDIKGKKNGDSWCDDFIAKKKEKKENPPPPRVCGCASYPSECGKDCYFPASAQTEVNKLAADSCKPYIAMCTKAGQVYYEEYKVGQKCWGLQEQCKNPLGEATCTCDGGGLISPSERTPATVGDEVVFSGFAFDADGIDTANIIVSVDGAVVGNATAVDACGAGGDASVCSQYQGKKPVIWSYTHTVTEGGNELSAVWKDAKGYEGTACKTATNLTGEKIQGDWAVSKSGGKICVDTDPDNPYVNLSYVITVSNRSTADQQIEKIVDQLDSKVLEEYIQLESISPAATVSGNTITWTLTGDDAIFAPDESKTYSYEIVIPTTAFGTYNNTATVYPVDEESIVVDESLVASCDVPDTVVPTTGLFDDAIGKIVAGVVLVFAGLAYLYIDPFENTAFNLVNGVRRFFGYEDRVRRSREKFEKRIVEK